MAPDGTRPARFEGHEYPQTLPEPDDIQLGEDAPWSTLPKSLRTGLTLEIVESRLRDSLHHFDTSAIPGDPGAMVVTETDILPITRRSAVLVALFEEDGETPIDTALREAREAVGFAESSVRSVGWLSP